MKSKRCRKKWFWRNLVKVKVKVVPVAERSKAHVYGPSLAGIAGSKPAGGMDGSSL